LVNAFESVRRFLAINMTVVALAALIVKANNANAIDHINSPLLLAMLSRRHRLGDFPNHNLQDRAIGADVLDCGDSLGCHVGDYANTQCCCQLRQQIGPKVNVMYLDKMY
jgi:hypothetical protein